MRILIAEDDSSIAKIMTVSLEHMNGHQVSVVENGKAAVEILKKEVFDLILLDSMMPELDGLGVCEWIQSQSQIQSPIIFLSAKTDEASIQASLQAGAIGYIQKPFDPMNIYSQIEEILKGAA